jgi:hypothetical protein
MNAMVFDSTGIQHIPGGLISPIVPIGKTKHDVWGLLYVQKDYAEIVAGIARNIGDFGFGFAAGPEFTPGKVQVRIAITAYYAHKKNNFYGYVEGYGQGGGLWYIVYYDRKITDWFAIGPYIQYESGIGGRLTLDVPKTPISIWGAVGHKGAVVGLQIFLEKKKS